MPDRQQPPSAAERLVARARVLASGKRQAVCQCQVFAVRDGEERLVAAAQGTISSIDTNRP